MKILTAKQMAQWDRASIKKFKIPAKQLMATAARRCSEILLERGWARPGSKVVIVCGPGNNGGDGFALASILKKKDVSVRVFFSGKEENSSSEAQFYFHSLKKPPRNLNTPLGLKELGQELKGADVVVDALFGTGLNRALREPYKKIIRTLNRASGKKFAVDMPSGLSGDTGEILGEAFQADLTVTFEVPKWGQISPPGWEKVGELCVLPIGLKQEALKPMKAPALWVTSKLIKSYFSARLKSSHKGMAGKVLVIAGSSRMPGAGFLCSLAALRAGAGLVTWTMPEEAFQNIDLHNPEVILDSWPSEGGKFSEQAGDQIRSIQKTFQAIALGPGLGRGKGLEAFLARFLKLNRKPLVMDADGLNLLADQPGLLKKIRGKILTPHPREMSRMTGRNTAEILKNRLEICKNFSKQFGVWVVLKGYRSVIAGPGGEVFINSTGGPNLAVAGSGDVLTGVVASLLAQGMSPGKALVAGVYLHGRAGDLLADKYGDRGTLASEIAEEIPGVIRELLTRTSTG